MSTTQTVPQSKDTATAGELYMSFELGDKSWKVTASDGRRAPSRYSVEAGDVAAVDRARAGAPPQHRIQVARRRRRSAARRRDRPRQHGKNRPREDRSHRLIVSFRAPERDRIVISLDDALNALANEDDQKARLVEMRFFGGLSVEESAEVPVISAQSVMRDWRLAKAWLVRELGRHSQI